MSVTEVFRVDVTPDSRIRAASRPADVTRSAASRTSSASRPAGWVVRVAYPPSAAETTERASSCTCARWSAPRKDSA